MSDYTDTTSDSSSDSSDDDMDSGGLLFLNAASCLLMNNMLCARNFLHMARELNRREEASTVSTTATRASSMASCVQILNTMTQVPRAAYNRAFSALNQKEVVRVGFLAMTPERRLEWVLNLERGRQEEASTRSAGATGASSMTSCVQILNTMTQVPGIAYNRAFAALTQNEAVRGSFVAMTPETQLEWVLGLE